MMNTLRCHQPTSELPLPLSPPPVCAVVSRTYRPGIVMNETTREWQTAARFRDCLSFHSEAECCYRPGNDAFLLGEPA